MLQLRIKDKFCRKRKDVLPLLTLSILVELPKAKGKCCRDFQNARKVLPRFLYVVHLCLRDSYSKKEEISEGRGEACYWGRDGVGKGNREPGFPGSEH